MTRYLLLAAFTLLSLTGVKAQDMNTTLRNTFIAFDTTFDVAQKTAQSNRLGLIAKKWNDQWVTHYYNAYAKAQLSYILQDATKRDALVDEAEAELAEAVSLLGSENDEIYVMRAMIAQARMSVDGRNRWQKYGKIFDENLRKAKDVNENNPRIYYLKGTATFYTPKMFGGGPKKAKPYFEKAENLFANSDESDMTKPFWGKGATQYFLAQINNGKGADGQDDTDDGTTE